MGKAKKRNQTDDEEGTKENAIVSKTFTFGKHQVTVQCVETFHGTLLSGHHDLDLTGLLIWPGALVMGAYLANWAERDGDRLQRLTCIELGSGAGLCGLLAAKFFGSVVLSDRDPNVLQLLASNRDSDHSTHRHVLSCHRLEWGNDTDHKILAESFPHGFDVVLAADVVYPGEASEIRTVALFQSACRLLSPSPDSSLLCSYYHRSRDTGLHLAKTAAGMGLRWELIPKEQHTYVLPDSGCVLDDGYMIKFTRAQPNGCVDASNPPWVPPLRQRNDSSSDEWAAPPGDDLFD